VFLNALKTINPEQKRPFKRPKNRWEDNIKYISGKWGWKM
jgi:hypothetical protein